MTGSRSFNGWLDERRTESRLVSFGVKTSMWEDMRSYLYGVCMSFRKVGGGAGAPEEGEGSAGRVRDSICGHVERGKLVQRAVNRQGYNAIERGREFPRGREESGSICARGAHAYTSPRETGISGGCERENGERCERERRGIKS